ncbi:MAG: universal stress protein [Hyphomicrobiaceae bacterium]
MFKKILVPIDVGHESSWVRVLPLAEQLALDYGAELHTIVVVPAVGMAVVGSFFPPDFEKKALAEGQKQLAAIVQKSAKSPSTIHMHVAHGTIYDEIRAAADKLSCDLIVMASHRPELKDYLLGPNAARVLRHARQSVFIVRD